MHTKNNTNDTENFIRKPTRKEKAGGCARSYGFRSLPEPPEGYENVYKQYGQSGAGYYVVPRRIFARY